MRADGCREARAAGPQGGPHGGRRSAAARQGRRHVGCPVQCAFRHVPLQSAMWDGRLASRHARRFAQPVPGRGTSGHPGSRVLPSVPGTACPQPGGPVGRIRRPGRPAWRRAGCPVSAGADCRASRRPAMRAVRPPLRRAARLPSHRPVRPSLHHTTLRRLSRCAIRRFARRACRKALWHPRRSRVRRRAARRRAAGDPLPASRRGRRWFLHSSPRRLVARRLPCRRRHGCVAAAIRRQRPRRDERRGATPHRAARPVGPGVVSACRGGDVWR